MQATHCDTMAGKDRRTIHPFSQEPMAAMIHPPRLEPGATIGLVCPASTPQRSATERAIERLRSLGFQLTTYGDLFLEDGYLAGSDAERARQFMEAWTDPATSAVLPIRGGYGVMRLLDLLDWEAIAARPKVLAGFSDITALHLAMERRANLVTFHAPHPQDGWGQEDQLAPIAYRSYWQSLAGEELCLQLGVSVVQGEQILFDRAMAAECEAPSLEVIVPGEAEGRLIGGNLALLCAMLGTPDEADTTGRILFIEDVGEEPYRLDRYLAQLQLAGKLDACAGVILGHFTDCEPPAGKRSLTWRALVESYLGGLSVPVVGRYPCGHDRPNLTLPLGVPVRLDASSGSLIKKELAY